MFKSTKEMLKELIIKTANETLTVYKRILFNGIDHAVSEEIFNETIMENVGTRAFKQYEESLFDSVMEHVKKVSPQSEFRLNMCLLSPTLCGYDVDFAKACGAGVAFAVAYFCITGEVAAPQDALQLNQIQKQLLHNALLEFQNEHKNLLEKAERFSSPFAFQQVAVPDETLQQTTSPSDSAGCLSSNLKEQYQKEIEEYEQQQERQTNDRWVDNILKFVVYGLGIIVAVGILWILGNTGFISPITEEEDKQIHGQYASGYLDIQPYSQYTTPSSQTREEADNAYAQILEDNGHNTPIKTPSYSKPISSQSNSPIQYEEGSLLEKLQHDSQNQTEPQSITVWIAGSGNGTKYHRNPNCSNMKNPLELAMSEALKLGYAPCQKCY